MLCPPPSCFGWDNGAHIGTQVFYSETDGMCITCPDRVNYRLEENERIYGCFVHAPSRDHIKRDMVVIIDGKERARDEVNPNWGYMYINWRWYVKPPQRVIQFLLVDHDSEEVLFRREALVNREEEEEEPEPDVKDLTDYDRIKRGVETVVNESSSEIIDEILRTGEEIANLEGSIEVLEVNIIKEVEEGFKGVESRFTKIGDQITGLKFPTIDNIKDMILSITVDLAEAIWDRILDKIEERYKK